MSPQAGLDPIGILLIQQIAESDTLAQQIPARIRHAQRLARAAGAASAAGAAAVAVFLFGHVS